MGLMQRRKGKAFERRVAALFRVALPHHAERIKRTIQSRGAIGAGADVQVPGLWIECQDARATNPLGKLAQAIRDAPPDLIPIAVIHRTGSRTIEATLRLNDLVALMERQQGAAKRTGPGWAYPVTIDLHDLLGLLAEYLG